MKNYLSVAEWRVPFSRRWWYHCHRSGKEVKATLSIEYVYIYHRINSHKKLFGEIQRYGTASFEWINKKVKKGEETWFLPQHSWVKERENILLNIQFELDDHKFSLLLYKFLGVNPHLKDLFSSILHLFVSFLFQ